MSVSQQLSAFNYSLYPSPIATLDVKTTGTSQVWRVPAGVYKVRVTVTGGGSTGQNSQQIGCDFFGGAGGSAGATAIKVLSVTPGNTLIYSVGAAAAVSQVSSGTQVITTIQGAASGGAATGGDINITGGGGGGGTGKGGNAGAGGASFWGGFGAYGSGGNGGNSNQAGSAGIAGVIVFEY